MTIREYMTTDVRTVDSQTTLAEAARVMRDTDTGVVPVVSGAVLEGVITDRDIVIRAIADGADPSRALVQDYLTRNPTYAEPETTIQEATQMMQRDQIRRLPVVEGTELIGIISIGDLAVDTGRDRLMGDTLQDISQPTDTTL
ncbi:MAG: CBS domain-containing protein [Chloroflexia bacterium]|nr:CBS domain-containing protein [Chloroflexia bacterium]